MGKLTLSNLVSIEDAKRSFRTQAIKVSATSSGYKIAAVISIMLVVRSVDHFIKNDHHMDIKFFIYYIALLPFLFVLIMFMKRLRRDDAWIVAIKKDKFWVNPRHPLLKNLGGKKHPILEIDAENIENMTVVKAEPVDYSWLVIELSQPLSDQIVKVLNCEQKSNTATWPKESQIILSNDSRVVFITWKKATHFEARHIPRVKLSPILDYYQTDYQVKNEALLELSEKHKALKRYKKRLRFQCIPFRGIIKKRGEA